MTTHLRPSIGGLIYRLGVVVAVVDDNIEGISEDWPRGLVGRSRPIDNDDEYCGWCN